MFQFNLRLDPEIVEDLSLNEDTVIEAYFDDGTIIVRILSDEEADCFDPAPCNTCPLFCKAKGIGISIHCHKPAKLIEDRGNTIKISLFIRASVLDTIPLSGH